MGNEECMDIMEEIKKRRFIVDVPELTGLRPGKEEMEVISIGDVIDILSGRLG